MAHQVAGEVIRRRQGRGRYCATVNVFTFLANAARSWPARAALRQGPRTIDYATAELLARQLAATLRARGVLPGDRVGCLLLNDLDHLLASAGLS